jgi:hypothetical protein
MSESGLHGQPDDAMVDLLVKQVTEGLSPAEQRELDVMDSARVSAELRAFERAAAALSLAGTTLEKPPAALQSLLERQAAELFAADKVVEFKVPPQAAPAGGLTPGDAVNRRDIAGSTRSRGGTWGWLAAAACLVLAIVGWLRSPPPSVAPVQTVQLSPPAAPPPAEPPAPPQPPTPAEERAAMLARPDTLKVTLGATKDPAAAGVSGDAVWDPATQKGYLHFVGLASNDPSVRQYQIWVFDAKRDKRYPVDGGVFDVPADASDVVIPIRASLSIGQAKAFAVTVEKPGGVVVSGLGHVVALGAAG